MKIKTKGFTLIELLVVIAIITILSTVAMAGLNSARTKGRDAKRLSDIKSLQKALELYYDTCGGYPGLGTGAYVAITAGAGNLNTATQDGNCTVENLGTYMNPLPVTPQPGGVDYTYCSMAEDSTVGAAGCDAAETTSYQITFNIENAAGSLTASGNYILTPSGIQGPV